MNPVIVVGLGVALAWVLLHSSSGVSGSGHEYVYVFSNTCGHCKKFKPVWQSAKSKFRRPGVQFSERESMANNEYINQHHIRGFPTVLHFLNGQEVNRISGYRDVSEFEAFIQKPIKQ